MLPNFEFENKTNDIEENFDVEILGNDDVSGTFFFLLTLVLSIFIYQEKQVLNHQKLLN